MGDKTQIEWTDATWNPVTGCTKVSQGCKHCYAERVFPRAYGKERKFTDVQCHPERLDQPLRWKKPRRIFVNSMSDLFHESVPDEFIDRIFAVMALAPRHSFQILTKRPHRMLDYLKPTTQLRCMVLGRAWEMLGRLPKYKHSGIMERLFPLSNVHLGVSCEDQATADERIPLLLKTPAAVRFISAEPLLGSLDLSKWLGGSGVTEEYRGSSLSVGDGWQADYRRRGSGVARDSEGNAQGRKIHGSLSASQGDAQRDTPPLLSAPTGMETLQRTDSIGTHGESQEWGEDAKPSRQSRAGHLFGADHSRSEHSSEGFAERREEQQREPQRYPSDDDPRTQERRGISEKDSGGFQRQRQNYFKDRTESATRLDWIICGGESGPHARPMHPEWARSLRDQCQAAGVPFFFKQWGEFCPPKGQLLHDVSRKMFLISRDGLLLHESTPISKGELIVRVGKKKAGAVLDGREWKEFPATSGTREALERLEPLEREGRAE